MFSCPGDCWGQLFFKIKCIVLSENAADNRRSMVCKFDDSGLFLFVNVRPLKVLVFKEFKCICLTFALFLFVSYDLLPEDNRGYVRESCRGVLVWRKSREIVA